jgi:hypothetical protein
MYVDRLTEFCNSTALNTGGAGSYLIGNQIDLVYPRDIGHGMGNQMYLVAQVSVAATSGGSATLQLALASDAQVAIAVNGTQTTHFLSPVFPVAQLTAGKVLMVVALPLEGNVYEKFVGIVQTTAAAAFTAGQVDVFLTNVPQVWKAHADEESR